MHAILGQAADPDEATHGFENFERAYRELYHCVPCFNDESRRFLRLFGNSRFLSDLVCGEPLFFTEYVSCPYKTLEKSLGTFEQEVANCLSGNPSEALDRLRRYKYAEYLRLTLRELDNRNPAQTYRELAHLAMACVSQYSRFLAQDFCGQFQLKKIPSDFALIGMGKLGGEELNYSSDIDLIGVYRDDVDTGTVSSHEFFCRLFARLSQDFSRLKQNRFIFRVDWDLRPEGKSGTLANSLSAMENYYETFGATWERQAFIKARTIHETGKLGDAFLQMMQPFIFRRSLDAAAVQEILAIRKRRLEEAPRASSSEINIKLDAGGIRDIEFTVQCLQLLWGGRIADLRLSGTVESLQALSRHGLIDASLAQDLTQSYYFLRRIESCLQMESEAQTHGLRTDPASLQRVARRMGWTTHDAGEQLWDKLCHHRAQVEQFCQEIH